jgi:hypothetical protein
VKSDTHAQERFRFPDEAISPPPFSVAYRERVFSQLLEWASVDSRIVCGAVVGSMAKGPGDRWSDLDLSFGVGAGLPVIEVLDDWTVKLTAELSGVKLFDLPVGRSIYRVFLLPGCLQLDVSFTPAEEFGAIGPNFKLLFGEAVAKPWLAQPQPESLFGYAVHHLLRGRICIERGRLLQAEYWISSGRYYALNLACLEHGLSASHAQGFDQLPARIRDQAAAALVCSLDRSSLVAALSRTVDILLDQRLAVPELVAQIEPQLHTLTSSWAG